MTNTTKRLEKIFRGTTVIGVMLGLVLGVAQPQSIVQAAAQLTVNPITWNVVGLDSNNVNAGPNRYPVGVRVCNTATNVSGNTAANVKSSFNWDPTTPNANINLRPESLDGVHG